MPEAAVAGRWREHAGQVRATGIVFRCDAAPGSILSAGGNAGDEKHESAGRESRNPSHTNVGTAMSKFGFFIAAAGLVVVSATTATTSTALADGFGWDGTPQTATAVAAASPAGFGWDTTPTTGPAAAPAATGNGFGWD